MEFKIALLNFFDGKDGRSFEEDVHLGRGVLSDNYGSNKGKVKF